jgi:hypothetical protein
MITAAAASGFFESIGFCSCMSVGMAVRQGLFGVREE